MGVGDVDWGSVAQWISSFSVPAALYIIFRDKRKAEASQATLIACWVDLDSEDISPEQGYRLQVQNASTQPVLGVFAKSRELTQDLTFETITIPLGFSALMPGETRSADIRPERTLVNFNVWVEFVDANGVKWARNVGTLLLVKIKSGYFTQRRRKKKFKRSLTSKYVPSPASYRPSDRSEEFSGAG
ncbi:hypothetical protein ACI784_19050 [Geodermatophilus sp. SYSU D01186]